MDLANQYNSRSPAVKRLMREAYEMRDPTDDYSASPVGDNLFEWHFTIRGASDSDFEGGVYHGRIIFPSEYPMKPPNILLLTPNGRFETNKKICLSISGHHPETWQPSWCVRTALLALIAFMPTPGSGTVGALDYTKEERQILARKSRTWECSECGNILNLLATNSDRESSLVDKCTPESSDSIENAVSSDNIETESSQSSKAKDTLSNYTSSPNAPLENTSELSNSNNTGGVTSEIEKANSEDKPSTVLPNVQLTRFDQYNLFSNVLSNFSNSKVTISILVLFIALLLYRRIFLLN